MAKLRNFKKLADGLDVSRLKAQVAAHRHLFVDLSHWIDAAGASV